MWLVINKQNPAETLEVPTEREAYDYVKSHGHAYYYEFINNNDYIKRKVKQWNKDAMHSMK